MRILMAAPVPGRREGGVAGVVRNLGQELKQLGHSVDYLFQEDVSQESYLPRRFGEVAFAFEVAARVLRDKGKYSVVNLHAPSGFVYGLLRKALGLRSGPPYVMTMHGLEERRIHAMSREARKGKAWHFALKNRLWHRLYHQPTYRLAIRTADQAILLNRETWSYVQLRYNRDAHRSWYVPNGVEERFFAQREYPADVAPRLLFVGTWLDQRGIYYLGEALKILAERLPGIGLTIAGCGGDPAAVKSVFVSSVHSRLEVTQFIESERMPAVYAAQDIFVFPSLMEGMPLVLLEAMAAGMPVVTTETCGMMDIIQDDINGILIPPADAQALVEAVLRLSGSVELRRRLGRAAQETARHYTWDRIARRVEKVFLKAMQNSTH